MAIEQLGFTSNYDFGSDYDLSYPQSSSNPANGNPDILLAQNQQTNNSTTQTTGWQSPTGQPERPCDAHGCGQYGASRGTRTHNGIDYQATAGDNVQAVTDGQITKIGWPYANANYRYIEITRNDGHVARIMYVEPDPGLQVGSTVTQGQTIGTVQSLQPRYPGITDHIHLEIRHNGNVVDPATLIP